MDKKTRVLVAVPTLGSMNTYLVARLLEMTKRHEKGEVNFHFTYNARPHDRARNQIVRTFLETDCTHLFFIDSDTVPPPDALKRLLAHDVPIVSGMTAIAKETPGDGYQFFDNCYQSREENDGKITTIIAERRTGLQRIFRCGASCLLVEREVFERVDNPYFKFEYNEDRTEHTRSEDIYFCDKVREAGYTLCADTDVICGHYKEIQL